MDKRRRLPEPSESTLSGLLDSRASSTGESRVDKQAWSAELGFTFQAKPQGLTELLREGELASQRAGVSRRCLWDQHRPSSTGRARLAGCSSELLGRVVVGACSP